MRPTRANFGYLFSAVKRVMFRRSAFLGPCVAYKNTARGFCGRPSMLSFLDVVGYQVDAIAWDVGGRWNVI